MSHYVGLDVSLKETSICIVDQGGTIICEGKAETDPESVRKFLEGTDLQITRVGIEAGGLTPWLHNELLAAGVPIICIETRHVKAALRAQNIKTDRNDARGIAHIMRTGWFRVVHVKSGQSQKLRVLLNNRKCLLSKRLDIESQIRGTLKVFGLKVGKVTTATYDKRIRELITDDAEMVTYIDPLLQARHHLLEQFRKLDKVILDIVKNDDVCRRFMTIPGVGALTALTYKTAIDCPARFARSQDVGPALGLTPRKYASGAIDYDGHITKCGDVSARMHLFEAAKVMMSRTSKTNGVKAWGLRIARRSSRKNACVAVARKLAVIMHRMWVDGTEFQPEQGLAA